jgi:hypothetical protein
MSWVLYPAEGKSTMPVLSPTQSEEYADEMLKTMRKGTGKPKRFSELLNDVSKKDRRDREIWLAILWRLLSIGRLELTENKRIRLSKSELERKK